jgi:hypothetical protein
MAVLLTEATAYINANFIDNEDWTDADDSKKQRLLNVAESTLLRKFSDYTLPDNAVYQFAAVLSIVFNDTNRLQTHGIAGQSITGVSSTTFKENNVSTPGGADLVTFIPQVVYEIVGEANNVKLGKRRIGRSVI